MIEVTDILPATGFSFAPPRWLFVLLWIVFAFLVFRVVVIGILRSGFIRAVLMAKIGGVSLGWKGIAVLGCCRCDACAVVRALIIARTAGLGDIAVADVVACLRDGRDAEQAMTGYVMACRKGLTAATFADFYTAGDAAAATGPAARPGRGQDDEQAGDG
jgi:hypothetical protein